MCYSHLDAARARLSRPQVLHLPSRTTHRRRPAQGCENTAILGLQHWKEEAQEGLSNALELSHAHALFMPQPEILLPRYMDTLDDGSRATFHAL
jgi:hypothetical protein